MKCYCGKPLPSGNCYCSRGCLEALKTEQAGVQSDAVRLYTAEPSDPYPEGRIAIYHSLDPPRRLDPG